MSGALIVLTGAGISAESGIRTFRASDGLWESHRVEDVASPEGFRRNPSLVQTFYNDRRRQLKDPSVAPNPAHLALAELESKWPGQFLLVTQNVDNLHERAGSKHLLHMHGELNSIFCLKCEGRSTWESDVLPESECPRCHSQGALRPDIVWFGEIPYQMDKIFHWLAQAELFISIGTSGRVYPAAGFAIEAKSARRIEVNLEASDIASSFHEHRLGPAGTEVPKLVRELISTFCART
ncbi:MAG: Sir2 family NAD+-dependent deacetylase [Bdellovibrionales bacterium]